MYGISDLKNGTVFEDGGQPWVVLEYQHSKMGRGGAVLKTKIKNLVTGATLQKTFQGNDKVAPVSLERKKAQYLYKDETGFVFMDNETYEQFTFGDDIVGGNKSYIKEGDTVELQYYKSKPISLNVPIKVPLKVTEAASADKGNTASSATKEITLETGLSVQAPMFIKEGDIVIIDTRDGSYIERAK
jgi:elongation factor P